MVGRGYGLGIFTRESRVDRGKCVAALAVMVADLDPTVPR